MSPIVKGRRCWAECLGDCSGGLSREHIVSESFFENGLITITGFDWTQDETQEIGLSNAVSKILCRAHNSRLSPLDAEIKTAREHFLKLTALISRKERTEEFIGTIDGVKFERWLLKTTINIIRASPSKYSNFFPDYLLTQMVFGVTPFNYETGQGLYMVDPRLYKNTAASGNYVNVRPIILTLEGLSCLLGSLVTFCGFPFFLNTIDPMNKDLRELNTNENINLIDKLFFHPPRIRAYSNNSFLDHQSIVFTYS
jgi:hypothetical protein